MKSVLLWGLVPPLILLAYTWHLDRIEREPVSLVLKVFIMGALSTFAAMALETIGLVALSFMDIDEASYTFMILENFLVVAFSEELCKRFPVRRFVWKNSDFNFSFDAIVYCLASALGFAAAENIFYMVSYGSGIAISRLIPVHSICAVYMGHYLGISKSAALRGKVKRQKRYSRLSLFIPILIHGFWDFALSTDEDIFYTAAIVMIAVLTVAAISNLHKYSREDRHF